MFPFEYCPICQQKLLKRPNKSGLFITYHCNNFYFDEGSDKSFEYQHIIYNNKFVSYQHIIIDNFRIANFFATKKNINKNDWQNFLDKAVYEETNDIAFKSSLNYLDKDIYFDFHFNLYPFNKEFLLNKIKLYLLLS